MAKCASCAALEEKGYVVTGDWTAEIRCGECNKVLFEGPSWPDPHLRWIRIGFAQKAAAPTAPFMSPEAFAKSTLNCITLSADAAEGWLSVTHPGQFVRATEPDPGAPNERTPVDWLLDLLTAAQNEAKRLTRERDAARAEVEGLKAWGEAQILEGKNRYGSACEAATTAEVALAAARAEVEKLKQRVPSLEIAIEGKVETVSLLIKERDAARGDASRLRREVAALNEKLDAACPQRCAKCANTATGLVSSWCAHCWRAAHDEEATNNIIQSITIESLHKQVDGHLSDLHKATMELHRIDTILAGRPALDKLTRAENIEHAIATAAKCDAALARVDQLSTLLERVKDAWPNGVGAPIMGRIMSLLAETKVTK